ncbi:MAG: Rid family detoxifying hydrolase [Bryobacteraceae bacterium]|jgi:2-iminobutanoate/2-iminopropanoate deaminase
MIERISTPGAPAPRGPYSPAVRAGDYIFVSGQVPLDPVTNQTRLGDIASETRQVLENIRLNLEGCGATLADVVKTTVFLANVQDFAAMNAAYAEIFGDAKPARTTIAVAALPLPGAKIEIEAIAYKPS